MAKKKKKPDSREDTAKVPFEQRLVELDRIVSELEDGNPGLSESLKKYEQAVRHLRGCYRLLDQAEKKVKLLTGVDDQGRIVTEDFDDGETGMEDAAPRTRRVKRKVRKVNKPVVEDDPDDEDADLDSGFEGASDIDEDMDDGGTLF